ncbi:MAG TPA: sulfatase-like hydrolase/transferase, partial [Candidatus Acidoferrales bacterium]|nr:sulfatase-like hydrolase/transferase [Candidatus Acidoferrales bacterium]
MSLHNMVEIPPIVPQAHSQIPDQESPWVASARFLLVWLFPALLGVYLKWYLMVDENGFAREARSMGLRFLGSIDRISFFRADIIIGGLVIPLALLILNRYMPNWCRATLTGAVSGAFLALVATQLLAIKEVGRFSSLTMILVGLDWGWHEPASNFSYLISKESLLLIASIIGMSATLAWAVRNGSRKSSKRACDSWKIAGELYLFALIAIVLISFKSDVLRSPYQESAFVRSASSLWTENAVDTGEFAGYEFQPTAGAVTTDMSSLSEASLIARYRELTHAPVDQPDPRYFGKEKGANVLFFVLETTPETYLPVDDDMEQFPNMARLRANSFVGTRHYTTFPITRCALFSVFSSWYPIDDPQHVFASPAADAPRDFLRRLASDGYETADFSPLRNPEISAEALFAGVGFARQYSPDVAITNYDRQSSWKEMRIAADTSALQLLKGKIDQWIGQGHKFVAAFVPQIGHFPYPDSGSGNSPDELRKRGRAILATEDAWLGELMDELQRHGQLDNTIIVILGDHGPRTIEENPDLRRGTIDEVAFHVPLFIYAPRALQHTKEIPWLTSHIDVAPTVLDLLGVVGDRDSEQGSAIWNRALAGRTTFFFAKQMFGADGYTSGGQFFMWHYFSDTVYQNS